MRNRTYFLIDRTALELLQTAALLDLLGYEGARVEQQAPRGWYLLSGATGPSPRWKSFGITVAAVGTREAVEAWAKREAGRAT